jgi:hypothetical protein
MRQVQRAGNSCAYYVLHAEYSAGGAAAHALLRIQQHCQNVVLLCCVTKDFNNSFVEYVQRIGL